MTKSPTLKIFSYSRHYKKCHKNGPFLAHFGDVSYNASIAEHFFGNQGRILVFYQLLSSGLFCQIQYLKMNCHFIHPFHNIQKKNHQPDLVLLSMVSVVASFFDISCFFRSFVELIDVVLQRGFLRCLVLESVPVHLLLSRPSMYMRMLGQPFVQVRAARLASSE